MEGRIKNPLKLVASEVTTESKIVFPEDWPLFYRVRMAGLGGGVMCVWIVCHKVWMRGASSPSLLQLHV